MGFLFSPPAPTQDPEIFPSGSKAEKQIKATLHLGAGAFCWMLCRESSCASLKKKALWQPGSTRSEMLYLRREVQGKQEDAKMQKEERGEKLLPRSGYSESLKDIAALL